MDENIENRFKQTKEEINRVEKKFDGQIEELKTDVKKSKELNTEVKLLANELKHTNEKIDTNQKQTNEKIDTNQKATMGTLADIKEDLKNIKEEPVENAKHKKDIVWTAVITALIGGLIGWFITYLCQILGG